MGERDEITQVRARSALGATPILLADADPDAHSWLRTIVAGHFGLESVDSGHAALDRIAAGAARLVIVGTRLTDMSGAELVARASQWLEVERRSPMTFLLADGTGASPDVDDKQVRVFYRLVRSMQAGRVRELLAQAAAELPPMPPREPDPKLAARIADHTKVIGAATEPSEAARAVVAAAIALVGADRARCLYCDEDSGALWSGTDDEAQDGDFLADEGHASGGLAGFAVRTVAAVALPHASSDPVYQPSIDDPQGTGRERIAVQPVAGPDGHVHAVIVAVRREDKPPFAGDDLDTLEALAGAWAPYLLHLSMRLEADEILGDKLDQGPSDIFRQEAIDHLVKRGARGDVVRVHPAWVRSAYWLVLASLTGAVVFASVARVHEYTEGPAVVRFTGRSDVVAFEPGTIAALEVTRGQKVTAGQVLVRLSDTEQAGQLRGLDTEFERKLVAYLQTPADPTVRSALAQVVSQRESARAGVESRVIRAPHDGVVKEVLVRNGQRVDAGKVVMTVVENAATEGLSVLAFLPGTERPRLRAHQHLRLSLPGYRGAKIGGEIRAVSAEVLGAAEARARYLGERLGESVPVNGTVVVVEAKLASPEFEADGQTYQLHDGMLGLAEVQLESRTVLETVIPGLKR